MELLNAEDENTLKKLIEYLEDYIRKRENLIQVSFSIYLTFINR